MSENVIPSGRMPPKWLEQTRARYSLYLALYHAYHEQVYALHECSLILGEIMRGRCYPWRVVGISHQALSLVKKFGSLALAKKDTPMCRAHLLPRRETAEMAICRSEPLTVEDLAKLQWDRDMTVVCLREENTDPIPLEIFRHFDNEDWAIFDSKQGLRVRKKEEAFIQKLLEQ